MFKIFIDWKNPYMSKDLLLVVKNFELKLNESSSRTISELELPNEFYLQIAF